MQGEITEIVLVVTAILERLGIPYTLVGSVASSLHGMMRSTVDIDILADVELQHVQPPVAAFSKEFYVDAEMIQEAVRRRGSFNLIHYKTAFKVDIFACG